MQTLSTLCKKALADYVGIFLVDTRTGEKYSYADLNLLVDKVVSDLQKIELVVIKLENGIDFIVYFLAAILSNRNLLLLNPSESEIESNLKIEIINLKYVFIDKSFLRNKATISGENLIVENPRVFVGTSATTGKSKLVPQSYNNIKSNIESVSLHHNLSADMTVATALPLYHVNALYFSFMASLISGSKLVLLDPFNILNHADWCKQHRVDILSTIPILISQYLRNAEKILFKEADIKYFISAAAPLSQKLLLDFISRYDVLVLQGYGLSEAINFSCTMPVNVDAETYDNAMLKNKIPSVGIALEGNDVEILVNNKHLTENEEEEGEIVISGENVFGGYYQDLEDDLFWNKYFKTGDLGYFKIINSKKYFFISGRIKEVAKINSESISLRWVDEYWAKLISIPYDFFSTSFYNEASGELLAAIVKLDLDDFENQVIFDFIVTSFDKIKGSYRPSVLIIGGKSIQIRTPSGKAKRWKYKEVLKQFSTYKKSKVIQIIKLEKE